MTDTAEASSSSAQLDAPEPKQVQAGQRSGFASFAHLLDTRILRALASLGFAHPTLVQEKAIPLALAGNDILARARTGSGKTLAYGLPVVQKVLSAKKAIARSDPAYQSTRALILVPTRELSEQVTAQVGALLEFCDKEVSIANIARDASTQVQRLLLSDRPDIVVATPSRALSYLQSQSLFLSAMECLAIDEADLILSYGHDDDVRALLGGGYLPKVFQSFLMSATMTSDVETLKDLVMRSPAILRLEEDSSASANLVQYVVHTSEEDKFLLAYVILKLRLIRGKCILFVNDIDRCYRLKLFLEQFMLRCCVLNSELPINSRFHIVQEFNKGVYDYIIATDESSLDADGEDDQDEEDEGEAETDGAAEDANAAEVSEEEDDANSRKRKREAEGGKANKKAKGKARKRDHEYGVSRGIDFVAVACVINFDLPTSSKSYTHRVGRTARAGRSGTALSFVVPQDQWGKKKVVCCSTAEKDEEVWRRIERDQKDRGGVKEWKFDKKQVEGFRYRMEDALRSVTRGGIKEARIKEIKQEILNSDKLKAHFEDNPRDLAYLRHDKALHPTRVQPHLKHVPSYLMPRIAKFRQPRAQADGEAGEGTGEQAMDDQGRPLGYVGLRNSRGRGQRGRGGRGSDRGRGRGRGGGGPGSVPRRKNDPLRKFSSK